MRWIIAAIGIGIALVMLAFSAVTKPGRPTNRPVALTAQPLVLNSADPAQTRAGELHYLGGWSLSERGQLFGGLSAMTIRPDGKISALSDSGAMFTFPEPDMTHLRFTARTTVLPYKKPKKNWMPRPTDSESLAADPEFRHVWVGYELMQLICRYTTDFTHIGTCRAWPEMKHWPETESLESLARLPDGRFLVIAEGGEAPGGGREALLFADDPVEPSTPHPVRMSYIPPTGYNPTDALWIGGDRLLVLNRRATLYDGFTAIVTVVDLRGMRAGAVLRGREVARLVPPLLSDNFEGMALERRDGQRILWLVSDDNHLFLQRTLLLKFALPDDL